MDGLNLYQSKIKMLLNLRNNNKENNYCLSDYLEDDLNYDTYIKLYSDDIEKDSSYNQCPKVLEDEIDSTKMMKELDDFILDVINTRQKLKLGRIKDKIKTREDILRFLNIKDKENSSFPPEPAVLHGHYKKFIIENNQTEANFCYDKIKNKLDSQNKQLQQLKNETEDKNNITTYQENYYEKPLQFNKEDDEKIFAEIKSAQIRCEDLLEDIDKYIEMGENI